MMDTFSSSLWNSVTNEREESMAWFLQCFREYVNVAPRVICTDQDGAIIRAVHRHLPTRSHVLNNWHLNKNQLKNCIKESGQVRPSFDPDKLNKDLHKLRKSETAQEYFHLRTNLEHEFFLLIGLPRWYTNLYYNRKEMIIRCFIRTSSSYGYLLQGSGYAESINSLYKPLILDQKLPICRDPLELQRFFNKKRIENS